MKKTKIIIPALAMMAVTAAAGISGSVAWFTANRTATFNAGTFAVVKTSENLKYDLTAGAGTTIENDGTTDPALKENVLFAANSSDKLTHGSYDHVNNNVLKATENGDAIDGMYALTGPTAPTAANLKVTDVLQEGTGSDIGDVLCAATWKIDFKLSFGGNQKNIGLFIDWSKTYFAEAVTLAVDADGTGYFKDVACSQAAPTTITSAGTYYKAPDATGKGFRIALVPMTGNPANSNCATRVMAKNQTIANSKYTYVASPSEADDYTEGMDGTAYAGHILLASDTAAADSAKGDNTTSVSNAANLNSYLGIFPFTANTEVTLSFMAVAWYEGTDPEIINRATAAEYEVMTADLAFEAVTLAA